MNMIDYIKWRGDLLFDTDPLNEIDNIILSRLSYLPLNKYTNNDIRISDLNKLIKDDKTLKQEDINLINTMAISNRFKDIILSNYVCVISKEDDEQFAAVTIIINKKIIFVSFCGTIDSIVGWHENFDMFYKKEVSGQIRSIKYLNDVLLKYKQSIYVGGHSKGGNLAIYSSSFIKPKYQKRIITIFNNDGPGFNDDIIKENGYLNIIPKIKTFVPETTIVSTFFKRKEKVVVINSTNKGIGQHNMYSWIVMGKNFIYLKDRDKNSYTIEDIINKWILETTSEEREEFTTYLFKMMDATNSEALTDLGLNSIKHIDDISKVYKTIDTDKRKEMTNILRLILSISTNKVLTEIKSKFKRSK